MGKLKMAAKGPDVGPAAAAPARESLIQRLAAAGEADLADLDAEIAHKEAEIVRIQGELDGARLMRKSLDWRLHGRPKARCSSKSSGRASAGQKGDADGERQAAAPVGIDPERLRIARILWNESTSVSELSRRTGHPWSKVNSLLRHPWFQRDQTGLWELSEQAVIDAEAEDIDLAQAETASE